MVSLLWSNAIGRLDASHLQRYDPERHGNSLSSSPAMNRVECPEWPWPATLEAMDYYARRCERHSSARSLTCRDPTMRHEEANLAR